MGRTKGNPQARAFFRHCSLTVAAQHSLPLAAFGDKPEHAAAAIRVTLYTPPTP